MFDDNNEIVMCEGHTHNACGFLSTKFYKL